MLAPGEPVQGTLHDAPDTEMGLAQVVRQPGERVPAVQPPIGERCIDRGEIDKIGALEVGEEDASAGVRIVQ